MRVAIIGSRNCEDLGKDEILRHLPQGCRQIISGGASGVDTLAEQVAHDHKISFVKIKPDYKKYGKNAPMIRNGAIVERADLVLAFWDYYSPGTANTIVQCIQRQIPVQIIGIKHFQ